MMYSYGGSRGVRGVRTNPPLNSNHYGLGVEPSSRAFIAFLKIENISTIKKVMMF